MSVTPSDVEQAANVFLANPTQESAAMYFSKAREAEENGTIGDDDWLNACSRIEQFLWGSGSID